MLYRCTTYLDDTSKIKTYVGKDGQIHFTDVTGADTVLPFSSSSGNFKLDIVIRVEGANYAGVQAAKESTITIKCVNGEITHTPAIGQEFGVSSYNIWQGDQTWTKQRGKIISVTYTPL